MKETIKIYHILGITILLLISNAVFPQAKQRIISLAPSLTHNLILLGIQDQIVGITNYCENNADESISIVASAIDVNIEKVASMRPDLVVATSLTNPEVKTSLKNLGIELVYFPLPKSFEEINSQFLELGKMVNREETALRIVKRERNKVEALKRMIPEGNATKKIFVEIGTKPLFCVIPNTFLDDYITLVGGINATADLNNGMISREGVLVRNPDVIVLATMGNVGDEEKSNWMNYSSVNAVKTKDIYMIDSDIACSPTPDHFTHTLELFFKFLYGKK